MADAIPFGNRRTPITPSRIPIRLRFRDPFKEKMAMLPFGCFRHLSVSARLRYSVFCPSLSVTLFRSVSIVRISAVRTLERS